MDELTLFLSQRNYDVLCIQSPNCRKHDLPKIEGYYYPPVMGKHPTHQVTAVATYICSNCSYETLALCIPGDRGHCVILLDTQEGPVKILNIYLPRVADAQWVEDVKNPK